jgi:hypothetical protein
VAKFRKKSIVLEAEQWFKMGDHPSVTPSFADPRNRTVEGKHFAAQLCEHCQKSKGEHGRMNTLEGGCTVCPGDWIIRGIFDEFYPCPPDAFEKTYELVEE